MPALEEGMEAGIHYDPMLAKIISYGMDREAALRKLIQALKSTRILGVTTNREYLIQILESDEFRDGRVPQISFRLPSKQITRPTSPLPSSTWRKRVTRRSRTTAIIPIAIPRSS